MYCTCIIAATTLNSTHFWATLVTISDLVYMLHVWQQASLTLHVGVVCTCVHALNCEFTWQFKLWSLLLVLYLKVFITLPKIKHPNRTIRSNRGKHVPSSTSTAECNIIHLMYKSCKQHSQYLNHKLHVINTSPLPQDCTTDIITGKLWINNNFIRHVTPCWAELSISVHTHLFIMSNELCLDMSWYHVHPSKDLTSLLFITKHTL